MKRALNNVLRAYRETGADSIEYKNAVNELNRAEDKMKRALEDKNDPALNYLAVKANVYNSMMTEITNAALDRYGQPACIKGEDVSGYFSNVEQCVNKYMDELNGGKSGISMKLNDFSFSPNGLITGSFYSAEGYEVTDAVFDAGNTNACIMQAVYAKQHYSKWDMMPYAKTQYDVRVRLPETGTQVRNYLENTEDITSYLKEFVIKGTMDETWAIDSARLGKTYAFADGTPFSKDEFLRRAGERPDEYQTLTTIADENTPLVYAYRLPPTVENFPVRTLMDDTQYANKPGGRHGDGDYIVVPADKNGEPIFLLMSVVNGLVFETTYEPANDMELGGACMDGADEEDLSDIMEDEEDFCM